MESLHTMSQSYPLWDSCSATRGLLESTNMPNFGCPAFKSSLNCCLVDLATGGSDFEGLSPLPIPEHNEPLMDHLN